MRILTFGGLSLEGSEFSRGKPLVLLTYLALDGPVTRRELAELFFQHTKNPRDSLSTSLRYLRREAHDLIVLDRDWVTTEIPCDAVSLQELLDTGQLEPALSLYTGPFLKGFDIDLTAEAEDWVYSTREAIARRVRDAEITLAEQAAGVGRVTEAAQRAERAYLLAGAPEPDVPTLTRLFSLFTAGRSPLAGEVRKEAERFGVILVGHVTPDTEVDTGVLLPHVTAVTHPGGDDGAELGDTAAKLGSGEGPDFSAVNTTEPQLHLIGRESELARLRRLEVGQWAWVQGGRGMGKTSLLMQLQGTHLLPRSGLPYATLDPILNVKETFQDDFLLYKLRHAEGTWLIDDWERIDAESRGILTRLRKLRPLSLRVVISSTRPPPFSLEVSLVLTSLTKESLKAHEKAWEKTGGVPALVGAYLRGEPLHLALVDRLQALTSTTQEVCLALALLDHPDPLKVREALDIDAASVLAAFKEMIPAGLASMSGSIIPQRAVRDYLEENPIQKATIGLKLARVLGGADAFQLFQTARPLWEEDDLVQVQAAYASWASELLRRGFPQRTVDTLNEAPFVTDPNVSILRARALERTGHYREALDALHVCIETAEVSALKGTIYWRLGQVEEAEQAAHQALDGDDAAQAEATNLLGHIEREKGEYKRAIHFYRKATALWRRLGKFRLQAYALNNEAVTLEKMGGDGEAIFNEALVVSKDNPMVQTHVLNNLAIRYQDLGRYELAERNYLEMIRLADNIGASRDAAYGWCNLGALYAEQERLEEAKSAYMQGLEFAREAEEAKIIGFLLENLAELTGDVETLLEALHVFESSGLLVDAEEVRKLLPESHPQRGGGEMSL